jgi:uncharacterized protein YgiM (DUF1202 family)
MKRSALLSAAVIAAITLSAAGTARAEDVWVSAEMVTMRAGMGAIYDPVTDLHKGDKLAVVERSGRWLKVSINGKEGYIPQTAISAQTVQGNQNWFKGTTNTASLSEGAANRPLRDGAVNYAHGKGLSPVAMQWIEDFRRDLRKGAGPSEWERFMQEGKVGNGAPQ